MSDKSYDKLLRECTECNATYCFLKELLLTTHKYGHRVLYQIKLVEIYKYLESQKEGRDIGWDEAMQRWVSQGHAARFAEVYKPNEDPEHIQLTPQQVYTMVTQPNASK